MSKLTTEEINNIRHSVNIVDIISSYIPLTKRGTSYFGVCPFHDDRDPSLSVTEEKQIYTCFSCGATGNVFNFIMDYDHVNFIESLKKIADSAGIELNIGNLISKSSKHLNLYEIYNLAQMFYKNNINTEFGKGAKSYLYNRKITDDIINEFGIGLSLKEHDLLTKLLIQKGFTIEELIKSGLVITNDYGNNDIYYNRIMFPLEDVSGKIVGYSGRTFNNEEAAKYINTKETVIFKKGELIYNYHRAREACRLNKSVIIVEGFMDVIRAHSNGIYNIVATMGTAFTKNQALLIKKLSNNVIICFDGDNAGTRATLACSEELMKVGVTPKVIMLENNMDPDDYILKYGVEKFQIKVNNPINIMDFKLAYFKENLDLTNNDEMAHYINVLINELVKINDDILLELTLKKMSEESKLDINLLRSKLFEQKKNTRVHRLEPSINHTPVLMSDKYTMAEQHLIYYMLKYKEVIIMYSNRITYMPTDRYRHLAQEINYFYKEHKYFELADFFSVIASNDLLIKTVGEIERLNLKDEYSVEEIDDYINVIRDYHINYERNRLMDKLRQEVDPANKAIIANKILELKEGV